LWHWQLWLLLEFSVVGADVVSNVIADVIANGFANPTADDTAKPCTIAVAVDCVWRQRECLSALDL